jgi:hypothetical protein
MALGHHLSDVRRAAILAQRRPTVIDLDKLREDEGAGLLANLGCSVHGCWLMLTRPGSVVTLPRRRPPSVVYWPT